MKVKYSSVELVFEIGANTAVLTDSLCWIFVFASLSCHGGTRKAVIYACEG